MNAQSDVAQRVADAGLDWIVPAWNAPSNVQAVVTTRNGPRRAEFDVGPARLDGLEPAARQRVAENRAFVERLIGASPAYLEQVHGAGVARIDGVRPADAPWPVADAAVTQSENVAVAVRVADCLPVLFCDVAGRVVAAAHAGWRGLAAGVLEATVEAMNVGADSILAWIGPGIGPNAFEVGVDVFDAFVARDPGAASHFALRAPGKWLADLPALAVRRLRSAGVTRIAGSASCTVSDPSRFHSYRRDRGQRRLGAYVWRSSTA